MVPPSAVLAAYALPGVTWESFKPGFSGAAVWRGFVNGVPQFAIKSWPVSVSPSRLDEIHFAHRAVVLLPFVPALTLTNSGDSFVRHEGRLFDISTWRPGEPDRVTPLSATHLAAAVKALASVHETWRNIDVRTDVCPAVLRRLSLIDEYRAWLQRNPGLRLSQVPKAIDEAERQIRPWATRPVAIQTCFTDIHRDHVFYTGGEVTGLIDFGAVKPDCPAADFARLFGDDPATLDAALALVPSVPADLARDLAMTAPAVNLAAWTLRLRRDGERPADPAAVARRMAGWEERLG